jgi:hypothetical protein
VADKPMIYSNSAIVADVEMKAVSGLGWDPYAHCERRLRESLADKPGLLLKTERPFVIDGKQVGLVLTLTKYPDELALRLLKKYPERYRYP